MNGIEKGLLLMMQQSLFACFLPEHVQQRLRLPSHAQQRQVLLLHEAILHGAAQLHEQSVVEAVHVQDAHGLVMEAQLGQNEHFAHLVDGAHAAGQGNEGVAAGRHLGLALGQGVGHNGFRDGEGVGVVGKAAGMHGGHMAPSRKSAPGHSAHEPLIASAVDQANAALGHGLPQGSGGLYIFVCASGGRTAENCNVHAITPSWCGW